MKDFMDREVTNMKIAVLSGKGGTGKTLVSVNLATAAKKSAYIDCDVEEPNGYLFFKPEGAIEEEVSVKIPKVDDKLCNGCRKCINFCKYNALAYIKDKVIVFDEICHSCGGCNLVCPENAITVKEKVIGRIQKAISDQVTIHTGILNIGEVSGIPIIKKLFSDKEVEANKLIIIDSPPGSACNVMESIKNADYCILVAEPTLFGVYNLNMVHELVKLFNKPFGVVLNKCMESENPAELFCVEKDINILARIPFDTYLGKLNSQAEIAVKKNKRYRDMFSSLLDKIIKEVQHEATTHPQR